MIGVSVKGAEKALRNIAGAAKSVRVESERAMRASVLLVRRMLALEMTGSENRDAFWGKKGAAGNKLSVRSGKTRASLAPGTRVYRTGSTLVGVVGSAEKHLVLHEDGGLIHGTSPKGYLRIPTRAAQTPAGVDRYAGRSIRDIPGAFLLKSKAGNHWAAIRKAGGTLSLLYLLKKSARIRPRRIFARTRDSARPQVLELTRGAIRTVVQKANA
jgi:hypothetical protein